MKDGDFSSLRAIPLIERIKKEFLERIIDGRFKPGERLPSEPGLAELLGVSRNSVREAVGLLENEGFLLRRKGVGTFVTRSDPLIRGGIERLKAIADFIRERGYSSSTTVEDCGSARCDASTAKRLDIEPGAALTVVETTKYASGKAVASCTDVIPDALLSEPVEADELAESVFDYLQKRHKINIMFAECDLIATVADAPSSRKLDVEQGAPMLLLEQVHYDDSGRKVLYSRSFFPSSRFTFKLIRRR